jgi:hypothetical protein
MPSPSFLFSLSKQCGAASGAARRDKEGQSPTYAHDLT